MLEGGIGLTPGGGEGEVCLEVKKESKWLFCRRRGQAKRAVRGLFWAVEGEGRGSRTGWKPHSEDGGAFVQHSLELTRKDRTDFTR